MSAALRRVLIASHLYLDPSRRGKLRALAARGLEVTVALPQGWIEPTLQRPIDIAWERQGGLEIFPIPARGAHHGRPDALRYGRRELRALLRDKRPDLVHVEESPLFHATSDVVSAARSAGIPATLFTQDNVERPTPVLTRARRDRALGAVRGVIAGGEAAAELARRYTNDIPVAVIPQLGVAVPPSPQHTYHEGLALGFVGRLVEEKGLDTLLGALVENREERWHLTVTGEGPERERLERFASDQRLAARIRWNGALPPEAVEHHWADLDVVVVPSRKLPGWQEPVGHVAMEAMAHEVAVVASDSGVLPEIIGDAGAIARAGDARAFAAALRGLAAPTERRPLTDAGRVRVLQRYSDDAVAEATISFWSELVR